MTKLRYRATLLTAMTTLGLAGCRVGPRYSVPPATAQAPPVAYKEAPAGDDAWKVAQPQDAMLRGAWWQIYNDADLNALEDRLNIDNQTLKVYFANYMQARTLIAEARSQYYPTVGVGPSITRSQGSGNLGSNTVGATGSTGGSQSTFFSLPATVSWAPDLWGKVRNQVSNAQFAAQASAADLENERLTEQASLAVYYFQLRGQDELLSLYKQTVAADQQSLDVTQASYDAGVGDYSAVVGAKNTLQNAQAAYTNLGILRAQYLHAIATLIGTSASSFSIAEKPFNATVPTIPLGLPSQLLERRPDVAAAERQMAAANAEIGVAYAAYYPTVSLSASGGFESSALANLLDWGSKFWSVGPTVSETVFDGGLRRATVRQYVSIYNADVATYRQTVLTAVQNVEDQLVAERILTTQLGQQEAAAQSAQEFAGLEQSRYDTGVDPYVNVMTAQLTLLSDQQALVALRTNRMTTSVALIEALGGGWDESQLPGMKVVGKKIGKKEIEKTP